MISKPDWDALDALFSKPALEGTTAPPSASEGTVCKAARPAHAEARHSELVCYRGDWIPKWLARDLMQERAAIYEFEAGMTREEAETKARHSLAK